MTACAGVGQQRKQEAQAGSQQDDCQWLIQVGLINESRTQAGLGLWGGRRRQDRQQTVPYDGH